MISVKLLKISLFAGTIAAGLGACIPTASSKPPLGGEGRATYVPIESIRYDLGSKSMSGYFVEHAATCRVTLMIIERSDPDASLPPSPTRVRLVLSPGQVAGLDSEEGKSLNFTCGEEGKTLLVDAGERNKLMAHQLLTLPNNVAKSE